SAGSACSRVQWFCRTQRAADGADQNNAPTAAWCGATRVMHMWTIAYYEPTGLFSLRPALSTASGAQRLLVPTPFAIKMALLDVAIHLYGVEQGAARWPDMRDLAVALALPEALVVNKT